MRLKKFLQQCWISLITASILYSASAQSQDVNLGGVAGNATTATDFFGGVLNGIFYVIGTGFVVASIIQYREFRNNSVQTPISKPIRWLIIGLLIGCFPLLYKYTSGKLPTLT
jgi:hypothetical protein